jgi:putative glutamine amidotransferase
MTGRSRRQPVIGITPDIATAPASKPGGQGEPLLVLQDRYVRAIEQAGAVPVVLPITSSRATMRAMLDQVDGLVVSGGDFDIHPEFYGEKPIDGLRHVRKERTEFELGLILLALKRDLPLLGICGGAQALNVALGGSLYQDIGTQIAGAGKHEQGALKERGGHKVKIHEGTKLRGIVGRASLEVNTTHHQAVKRLGKGLLVNATAGNCVIEGIESEDHAFVLGVQWHPEFLVHRDPAERKLFSAFTGACKGRK